VDARLVRVSDARDLWSHVYERPVGEAGAIVEQIRRSVTRALGLGQGDSPSLRRGATTDVVAYDYYLRALDADGKDQRDEAVHLLGRAIARDSGFALAYARLADLYMSAWAGAPADRWGQVRPLVEKALELDSTLALAHRTAGWIAMWQDRDWDTAERHLSRSLALDSSDVWTYYRYAACLAATGRTVESLSIARRATRIDPISSTSATEVGLHLYWNRRYDEAIAVLERAKVVDNYWWQKMPMVLGRAYLATGRYQDAIREFRRAGVQTSEGFEAPALLAHALGRAGRIQEANVLITQYWDRARAASARPVDLAVAYLGMADTARALDWVERIPGDTGSRFYLLNEPIFDSVRGTPRFRRVLEALGLGAAATRADSIREAGTAFPRPLEAADQKALRHS
jgi:tetratricopeptide (TPR) repeat protein